MEIRESREGGVVVIEPVGKLDTKTSMDFEKKIVDLLTAGERRFVVDFGELEYISSAGLRVLLMLGKKAGASGSLVLCSLNKSVRDVFDIAGFTSIFKIADTRDAALRLSPEPKGARKPAPKAEPPAPKEEPAPPPAAPKAAARTPSVVAPAPKAAAPAKVAPERKPEPKPEPAPKPAPPSLADKAARAMGIAARGPAKDEPASPLAERAARALGVAPKKKK